MIYSKNFFIQIAIIISIVIPVLGMEEDNGNSSTPNFTNSRFTDEEYFTNLEDILSQICFYCTGTDTNALNIRTLERLIINKNEKNTDLVDCTIIEKAVLPPTVNKKNIYNYSIPKFLPCNSLVNNTWDTMCKAVLKKTNFYDDYTKKIIWFLKNNTFENFTPERFFSNPNLSLEKKLQFIEDLSPTIPSDNPGNINDYSKILTKSVFCGINQVAQNAYTNKNTDELINTLHLGASPNEFLLHSIDHIKECKDYHPINNNDGCKLHDRIISWALENHTNYTTKFLFDNQNKTITFAILKAYKLIQRAIEQTEYIENPTTLALLLAYGAKLYDEKGNQIVHKSQNKTSLIVNAVKKGNLEILMMLKNAGACLDNIKLIKYATDSGNLPCISFVLNQLKKKLKQNLQLSYFEKLLPKKISYHTLFNFPLSEKKDNYIRSVYAAMLYARHTNNIGPIEKCIIKKLYPALEMKKLKNKLDSLLNNYIIKNERFEEYCDYCARTETFRLSIQDELNNDIDKIITLLSSNNSLQIITNNHEFLNHIIQKFDPTITRIYCKKYYECKKSKPSITGANIFEKSGLILYLAVVFLKTSLLSVVITDNFNLCMSHDEIPLSPGTASFGFLFFTGLEVAIIGTGICSLVSKIFILSHKHKTENMPSFKKLMYLRGYMKGLLQANNITANTNNLERNSKKYEKKISKCFYWQRIKPHIKVLFTRLGFFNATLVTLLGVNLIVGGGTTEKGKILATLAFNCIIPIFAMRIYNFLDIDNYNPREIYHKFIENRKNDLQKLKTICENIGASDGYKRKKQFMKIQNS